MIFNEHLRCSLVPLALQLNMQEDSTHRKESEMQEWASELQINAQAPNEFTHGHPITSCLNAHWRHAPAPERSMSEHYAGYTWWGLGNLELGGTMTQELPCAGQRFP